MTTIQLDSTAKSIHVALELKGEPSPLLIDVKSYELTTAAGETHIELGAIETSREWLNVLVEDLFKPENRRFKMPGALKALL
jgi:hypothetical protein